MDGVFTSTRRAHGARCLLVAGAVGLCALTWPTLTRAAQTWEGTWSTRVHRDFPFVVTTSAGGFSGTMTNDDGTDATPGSFAISLADAAARRYTGSWQATNSYGANFNGPMELTLALDGRSFTGWRLDYSRAQPTKDSWLGTCIAGACLANTVNMPPEPAFPALPSALVPLSSVANGCGGGTASTDPRWGDTSSYLNTNNPFGTRFPVNFREACNMHDAGYSGAMVKDPLRHDQVTDFYRWSQKRIDAKFLFDMRMTCARSIPATARGARADCRSRGGATSFGAKWRYDLVRRWGRRYYVKRYNLSGRWRVWKFPNEPAWTFVHRGRSVTATWDDGKGRSGEFAGTLISRDTDSLIKGYEKTRDESKATWTVAKASILLKPSRPSRLSVSMPSVGHVVFVKSV